MKAMIIFIASGLMCVEIVVAQAQSPAGGTVPVTLDNFARAESDAYIGNLLKEGRLATFKHNREPASIDNQTVIRLNRDTLYSFAVFDLDAGPVTITMPNAGKRFMSLQVINEDHYVPAVYYGAGSRKLTKENVGTRYVVAGVRTLVDPNSPEDLKQVHDLQDGIKASQKGEGKVELPNWDQAARKDIHDALLVLAKYAGGFAHAFGAKGQVDPVRHLIGTSAGWGGNPGKTRPISASRHRRMTATRSTSSTSRTYQSIRSGQSVSIMLPATTRKTRTMPIRSTISLQKRIPMVR